RHTVHADMLTKAPDVLTKSVTQVLGGTWQVRCEVGGGQGPRGAGGGRAANSQEPPTAQVGGAVAGHPAPSPRSARPTPTGERSSPPDPARDDGWPTPARPGGDAPRADAGAPGVSAPSMPPRATEDWPTPAQPGGPQPDRAANGTISRAASHLTDPGG